MYVTHYQDAALHGQRRSFLRLTTKRIQIWRTLPRRCQPWWARLVADLFTHSSNHRISSLPPEIIAITRRHAYTQTDESICKDARHDNKCRYGNTYGRLIISQPLSPVAATAAECVYTEQVSGRVHHQ